MDQLWHKKFVKLVGVNNWAPEWYSQSIKRFDAEALADAVAKTGAAAGLTFQGFGEDHFGVSFFQTELGHRHVNLAPGRDHIREYAEALHKRGLKFFAYYCYQDKILWDSNPDWRQCNERGEANRNDAFGNLCPNSPYREHFIRRMLEITSNYDIDGWLLDMLQFDGSELTCYCPYCQRKYLEQFGLPLPKGKPDWSEDFRRFLQWRCESFSGLLEELVARIKAIKPDCMFTHNAFALRSGKDYQNGADYERHFLCDDVVTDIMDWGGSTADRRVSRYVDMIWQAGFFTRVFKGLSGKPVWMQMGRFPYNRDYQAQPVRELTLSSLSVAINGGCPFLIDNVYPDGTVDPVAAERIAQAYGEVAKYERHFGADTELAYAGVFYSASSLLRSDLNHPGRYLESFKGTCKTLTEGHLPYQVIGERTFGRLSEFKVVILPDAAVMSAGMADAIRAYVRGGGSVVATGSVSLVDENGETRSNFALADVFGADFKGFMNYSVNYLRPAGHEIASAVDKRLHIPLREYYPVRVKPRADAETVADLEPSATEFAPGVRVFTYADDVPPSFSLLEPNVLANRFGLGRCVYSGADLGRVYGVYGYPEPRELLLSAIAWCAEPAFTTDAPGCVETACYRKSDEVAVHFLNYAVSQMRSFHHLGGTQAERGLPVYNVTFTLRGLEAKPASAALSDGTELPFEYSDGAATATVPVVDLYEVVVFKK